MRQSKLFQRTLFLMVLLFGVVSVASTVLSAWTLYTHMTDEYISKGRAIARSIASSSVEILLNRDISTIQAMIDQFLEIQGAAYVCVEDAEGRPISHTFVPQVPPKVLELRTDPHGMSISRLHIPGIGDVLDISKPILAGVAGYVHVGMDMGLIRSYIFTTILRMQALLFAIFLLSVLVLYLTVRKIAQPLNRLTDYAQKLRNHDFSARVHIESNDEIGLLAETMTTMARELSELISNLEQEVEKATSDLSDTLAYLEGIIENMADGMLVADRQMHITLHNPALTKMFGLPRADLSGRYLQQFFCPEISEIATQAMLAPDQATTAEIDLLQGRYGKAVATAIRRKDRPDPLGAVILVRDITAEKEVDLMKTDFITTVSHELRTPLTSVLGFAKIIKKKLESDIFPGFKTQDARQNRSLRQVTENLQIIVSEGERLTELINDVLDIAKMESGKLDWRMQSVDVAQAIEHALAGTRTLYEESGLELRLQVAHDLPIITADYDRIIQVLVNLVSNAVKFTKQGWLECEARRLGEEQVLVRISDSGVGIAEADQERIFERFRQAGSTITEKPKGTGLGLPICKEIVEYHGGRIWVESAPGQGSSFYFTLPVSQPEETPQPEPKASAACPAPGLSVERTPAPHPSATANRPILVVDDDPSVCSFLQQVLESEGYVVTTASSGQEAIEKAKQHLPSLITMDLLMPGMDGGTAISHLRKDPLTRHIPVLVISAVLETVQVDGSDAGLVKPVDEDILLHTVHGLLHSSGAKACKCLVLNNALITNEAQLVRMCSGEMRTCHMNELWGHMDEGFSGTVIVPAGASQELDLTRLSSYPNVLVIVMPE